MYYPNARRLASVDAAEYFLQVVKPKLPQDRGMRNHGEDTPLRSPVTPAIEARVSLYIQHAMLYNLG